MFKRFVSLLAILSVFNMSLSFQLKQRFSGDKDAETVYHHTGQRFYYVWNFLDNAVENTVPVSQTTLVKYVSVHFAGIPLPVLFMLVMLVAVASFTLVFSLPQTRARLRIKLLPEHSNYLFRLKPF